VLIWRHCRRRRAGRAGDRDKWVRVKQPRTGQASTVGARLGSQKPVGKLRAHGACVRMTPAGDLGANVETLPPPGVVSVLGVTCWSKVIELE
jgi:hypothetical protein